MLQIHWRIWIFDRRYQKEVLIADPAITHFRSAFKAFLRVPRLRLLRGAQGDTLRRLLDGRTPKRAKFSSQASSSES